MIRLLIRYWPEISGAIKGGLIGAVAGWAMRVGTG